MNLKFVFVVDSHTEVPVHVFTCPVPIVIPGALASTMNKRTKTPALPGGTGGASYTGGAPSGRDLAMTGNAFGCRSLD